MSIVAEIADANLDAAQKFMDEVQAKTEALQDHPRLYKLSRRIKGLREMVIRPNYVLFYRESGEVVEIVNLVHARRQWPPLRS